MSSYSKLLHDWIWRLFCYKDATYSYLIFRTLTRRVVNCFFSSLAELAMCEWELASFCVFYFASSSLVMLQCLRYLWLRWDEEKCMSTVYIWQVCSMGTSSWWIHGELLCNCSPGQYCGVRSLPPYLSLPWSGLFPKFHILKTLWLPPFHKAILISYVFRGNSSSLSLLRD
jgi:hypothetical protein